jgi:hypothetical protein
VSHALAEDNCGVIGADLNGLSPHASVHEMQGVDSGRLPVFKQPCARESAQVRGSVAAQVSKAQTFGEVGPCMRALWACRPALEDPQVVECTEWGIAGKQTVRHEKVRAEDNTSCNRE